MYAGRCASVNEIFGACARGRIKKAPTIKGF